MPQHPFGDDLRNIAQQLAREQVRDADLVDWLIDKRVDATLRLVDELWPTVTKVAQAQLQRGELDQADINQILERQR